MNPSVSDYTKQTTNYSMKRITSTAVVLATWLFTFLAAGQDKPAPATAPYPGWQHSGVLLSLIHI